MPVPIIVPDDIQAGDVLLFARGGGLSNWIIKAKTWSRFTHVEVVVAPWLAIYDGKHVAASRPGIGARIFGLQLNGLALILRPKVPFSVGLALQWFYREQIDKMGYDWVAILNFTYARFVNQANDKMFCSEFATRFLRHGGIDPFPEHDADTISPRDFSTSPLFDVVWRSPKEEKRYRAFVARDVELEP